MVLIFLTVVLFISGSRIGVLVLGPPLPCVLKSLLAGFLLLLDRIPFGNCPGVFIKSVVVKIGTSGCFSIRRLLHRLDCAHSVLLFYTARSALKTGLPIRFCFSPLGTAFGAVSSLASSYSPLSV